MTAWAKMSSNLDSNPKIRRAGRNGREVFLFALRRNAELDLGGIIPAGHLEAWYLADQLMMSEEDAVSGLSACVRTGLLRDDGAHFLIAGWDDEWGKRPLTEAERKRKQRAKPYTSDEKSGHVTTPSGQVRTGPECHALDQRREEEIRVEEKRESGVASDKPKRKQLKSALPDGWTPDRNEPNDNAWRAATARGVDCRLELERFRDHAKSGDWRKVDWQATWRNWTRSARPTVRAANSNSGLQAVLDIARGES